MLKLIPVAIFAASSIKFQQPEIYARQLQEMNPGSLLAKIVSMSPIIYDIANGRVSAD